METTRQKKIAGILQNDITTILQKLLKSVGKNSVISSITKVKISPDLSIAKIYVSVFPVNQAQSIFELIEEAKSSIRNSLGILIKNQVRRVPALVFYIDDSLEHISKVEKALEGKADPIKNSDLLEKRKSI
ncbi:30S ribosome-binding factor RbfA [Flavobacteriaceae bacterium]|jgi:ribosome-binding factor A|nr:30S ribosome-binding factor RbfA [Flavobacteriaceae bacterium]|tara:strand:- start:4875 stop:5267 length:393 start_codon:yes stop_codon:yes gene_type:complete